MYQDRFDINCEYFYWDKVDVNATMGACKLQKGLYEEAKCEGCKYNTKEVVG